MKNGYAPIEFDYKRKRAFRLKSNQYQLVNNVFLRRNYDSVLLRGLDKPETEKVLQELHDKPLGWHYSGDTAAHNILHVGYYWPTLFKDTHAYVRKWKICQNASWKENKPTLPLQPINIKQPFEKWGPDIISEILSHSSKQHIYILIATDYFTKWVEAIPLKVVNFEVVIDFIDQYIITRFDLPFPLMFDNASYFYGNSIIEFSLKRGFKVKYYTNYYPQGNGLHESANKNLIRIIKWTIDKKQKNWHKALIFSLLADKITHKSSLGTSPYHLVYGKEAILPPNLAFPSLALVQSIEE